MRVAVALMIMCLAFAGCSDEAPADDVVVINGNAETAVHDADAVAAPQEPEKVDESKVGHIAGVVVDEAIHPIKGATVTLPSLAHTDIANRNGDFEFVDLAPGSYLIRVNATDHYDAEALVTVKKGEFTRLKIVLQRIPPAEPYVEVQKFAHFATTTDPFISLIGICSCRSTVQVGLTDLNAMVFEAVMEPNQDGSNSFNLQVRDQECCTYMVSETLPNPAWIAMDGKDATPQMYYATYPLSSPLPEVNKEIEAFASAFYNQAIPDGYSVVT